jgi:hypothetical protein
MKTVNARLEFFEDPAFLKLEKASLNFPCGFSL